MRAYVLLEITYKCKCQVPGPKYLLLIIKQSISANVLRSQRILKNLRLLHDLKVKRHNPHEIVWTTASKKLEVSFLDTLFPG